jgi:hypothetical protein
LYDENNHNGFDINIVKNIKGSAAAYAGGSSNNHMHIVFATEEFALSQIPHEFMHLIDNRIYDYYAYNATDAFSDGFDDLWMNLNKDGFVYDDDADYDGNYFVSYYAMTNWLEDRAETFMYLCDESYGTDWYTSNKYLKKKADFLIDAIRLAFPSVQKADSVYWTRNIKN